MTAGNLLIKYKKVFDPYLSSEPGRYEADPKMFYNDMKEVCLGFLTWTKSYDHVRANTSTTQRDTSIIVDEHGEPIRNAIIWMDRYLDGSSRSMRFIVRHLPQSV